MPISQRRNHWEAREGLGRAQREQSPTAWGILPLAPDPLVPARGLCENRGHRDTWSSRTSPGPGTEGPPSTEPGVLQQRGPVPSQGRPGHRATQLGHMKRGGLKAAGTCTGQGGKGLVRPLLPGCQPGWSLSR